MKRENNHGKSGMSPLFLLNLLVFALSVMGLFSYGIYCLWQNARSRSIQKELQNIRGEADAFPQYEMQIDENGLPVVGIAAVLADIYKDMPTGEESSKVPEILPKYKELYALNPDLIGWLSVDGTVIDYPVMQTMEDEGYYLQLDFYGCHPIFLGHLCHCAQKIHLLMCPKPLPKVVLKPEQKLVVISTVLAVPIQEPQI